MIIINIIILYFKHITHTDDFPFPSTGTRVIIIIFWLDLLSEYSSLSLGSCCSLRPNLSCLSLWYDPHGSYLSGVSGIDVE